MRSIFHKLVLAPAVMAAAALISTAAMAETTVKIPFSFTASGKACPAGTYTVRKDMTGNFVTLFNRDSAQSFSWVLVPGAPHASDRQVDLKFDQSGETHALRTIQYGTRTTYLLDKQVAPPHHNASESSGGR